MLMMKRSREAIADGVNPQFLKSCIKQHLEGIPRMDKLDEYYRGMHKILCRQKTGRYAPNNRIVNSYPKYITDTVCGYMFGNAVTYAAADTERLDRIRNAFKRADIDTHDAELGKNISVFGIGYELIFMSSDDVPAPKAALIDPRNAFVVYDDTVEEKPLLGVCYYPKYDAAGNVNGYSIIVYTSDEIHRYEARSLAGTPVYTGEFERHPFGNVPLIEYWNNEEGMGDFEHVLGLIDAYDVLQSDRINDKERFVNAILLIINGEMEEEAAESLKDAILSLPEGTDARYLTKLLNEAETDILSKSLSENIHKFSHTPDFSDENFSGNASGVAFKFKTLSLEYLAKVKERFFAEGLRQRLDIFARVLGGGDKLDAFDTDIIFNRTLPLNELETSQIITSYANSGTVSHETLLTQIPFVKNIPEELERLSRQQDEKNLSIIKTFNQDGNNDDVRL